MNCNHITRQRMVAMHLWYGGGRIQCGQQCIYARRRYHRRAQGAKRAVAVCSTFQRRGLTRIVRSTNPAQRHRICGRQRVCEHRRRRHQCSKQHSTERDPGDEFFAAAGQHGAIIMPVRPLVQARAYPGNRAHESHWRHATFLDSRRIRRRGKVLNQSARHIRLLRGGSNACRKHGDFLYLRWQGADIIGALHRQYLADLLKADFGVTARHHHRRNRLA